MQYRDLRDFLDQLEQRGQLKRIRSEVDPHLEMTEICDRTLRAGGPALLFENPRGYSVPVLGNLFGTPERVALGMGEESVDALREVGVLLSQLKEPEPPKGMKDAWDKLPVFRKVLDMAPKTVKGAACQKNRLEGDAVDLSTIPPILGYNVVKPREGCETPLEWPDGSPAVCIGQFGQGRVLAYTSDPAPHWGCNFVYWDGYQKFWSQALEWLLGAPASHGNHG